MALKSYLLEDYSGGVNLTGQPLAIGENDLLAAENMHAVASGYLIGRGGQTNYNATPIDANPVKSLYRFYKQDGTGILLACSGTQVYRGNDALGTFTVIHGGYSLVDKFSFTTWSAKDKVYWQNPATTLKSYDGTTVVDIPAAPIGLQVEYYLDRLYMLMPNAVRFTDLAVDNVWPGAAQLNISDNLGGVGTFLKAANRVLIAGKTSGLWRLEGSPLLGNSFIEYSKVGCIAPWTADIVTTVSNGQVIPVGVAFLGKDGVYVTDGYQVTLVSSKIDRLFSAYFRGAVGKYYPKKRQYFLSFNTSGGANDQFWVATNLDMKGSRVSWTPYTGFNCDSFAVWDGGADNGELYSGRSDGGTARRLDIGKQDVGGDYRCAFTTHYLGDPSVNKQVRWLKPVFDAQNAVHYSIDYFQKQFSSGPVSLDTPTALIWNVGFWNVGTWAGPSLNSARTSIIDGRYGRYLSISFQNTGDGPDFKFFQLACETRVKDQRFHDPFTLNVSP